MWIKLDNDGYVAKDAIIFFGPATGYASRTYLISTTNGGAWTKTFQSEEEEDEFKQEMFQP